MLHFHKYALPYLALHPIKVAFVYRDVKLAVNEDFTRPTRILLI